MDYITYYRVSTNDQNLGLDAQRTIIGNYLKNDDRIISEYSEKETGTNERTRIELQKATNECKEKGATLLIAKLDRLARNVSFISTLVDSNVEFKALDLPDANKLTIHIFSALAEHEAELISTRTKSALTEIKTKIKKNGSYTSEKGNVIRSLGNIQNLTDEGRLKGSRAMAIKKNLNENNRRAKAHAKRLRKDGLTFQQIAVELNTNGFQTSKGKEFHPIQVSRLLV